MLKFKILGLSLIGFISLWLILFFTSDSGYPRSMFNVSNIDSVIIDKGGNDLVIYSKDTLNLLVGILSKYEKLNGVDKPNINRDSYRITFFVDHASDIFDLMVSNNVYHG